MAAEVNFYDAASDDPIEFNTLFSWGSQRRGASIDRQFRVFNESQLYTAEGVLVTTTGFSDAAKWLYFSVDDGVSFHGEAQVGDLVPLQYSGIITARLIIPSDAPFTSYAFSTQVSVPTWS